MYIYVYLPVTNDFNPILTGRFGGSKKLYYSPSLVLFHLHG